MDDSNDFKEPQQSAVTTYYKTELIEIKEEMIDQEQLKKTFIKVDPVDEQIVEKIALSNKDLIQKYYNVKKEKNRTYYFCKKCGKKQSKCTITHNTVST